MALVEIPDFLILQLYSGGVTERINERLTQMEKRMSELTGAVAAQSAAITDLTERINDLDAGALQTQVNELTAALQAERDARAALAELEAQEDVQQGQELAEAQGALDAASQRVAELTGQVEESTQAIVDGVAGIQANTARLQELAQPAPEEPVDPEV